MRMTRYAPLVLVFWLAGCASIGLGGRSINLISIEQEWEMGRQFEAEIAREMTLVRDPAALAYVSEIGQQLVAQTNMSHLPWRFHIVEDPSINAFNVPGGLVYVHTGLIANSGSVAELAAVMAHEVAHGVERHGTARLTQIYGLNILAALVLGGDPSLVQQIVAQIAGTGAIASFSRGAERDADRLGVHFMYGAGYDPQGMVSMFQTLLAERSRRPGTVEQFFATHPLTEDRIQRVRNEIASLPPRQGLITHDARFADLQQRVR